MYLSVDDLEVPRRGAIGVAELGFEQLKVNDDCVNGVLDFVADAGGESADGSHAP